MFSLSFQYDFLKLVCLIQVLVDILRYESIFHLILSSFHAFMYGIRFNLIGSVGFRVKIN